MGVLTDYFLASPKDLAALSSTGEIPPKAPRLQAKRFGVVELKMLAKELKVKGDGTPPGEPQVAAEDFSWFVLPLTKDLVVALAALDAATIGAIASVLSKSKDSKLSAADVTQLLGELATLARKVKPGKTDLFLWTSV